MKIKIIASMSVAACLAIVCVWLLMGRLYPIQEGRADVLGFSTDAAQKASQAVSTRSGTSATKSVAVTRYLPFEAGLIRNGGLSVDEIQRLLPSKKFSDYLVQASNEAIRDGDANALTQSYRRNVEGMLKGLNGLRLEGISCGLSVCVGNVVAVGDADATQYQTWLDRTAQPSALPSYAFVDGAVETGGGVVEHRFFFSMDKSVAAVTGHR